MSMRDSQLTVGLPAHVRAAIRETAQRESRSEAAVVRQILTTAFVHFGTVSFYGVNSSDPIAEMTIGTEAEHRMGIGERVQWVVFRRNVSW